MKTPIDTTWRSDEVKGEIVALLEASKGPLPAREISARVRRPLRDVVNALCDGSLFYRVSRSVYGLTDAHPATSHLASLVK